jgi:hypothetical protein
MFGSIVPESSPVRQGRQQGRGAFKERRGALPSLMSKTREERRTRTAAVLLGRPTLR